MASSSRGRLLRRVYVAVLVAVLVAAVVTRRDELRVVTRDASAALLALTLAASFGQLVLTSAFWRSALGSFGEPVPFRRSLLATLSSLPARYLPGSVWYAVSRVARLRRSGARASTLGAVAALEMALVPVVAFSLGGLLLAVAARSGISVPLGLGALALALATTPPVVNRLLGLLRRVRPSLGPPPVLRWPAHLRLVAWTGAFWVWSGSVFALYVLAFPALSDASPVLVAGAYMVAWGLGWLAIFAPQGVGVVEVTLAALIAGGETAAGVAVVLAGYRALIAVRDLLAAGAATAVDRRSAPRAG